MLLGIQPLELGAQNQFYVGGSLTITSVEQAFIDTRDVFEVNTIWGYNVEPYFDLGLATFMRYQNEIVWPSDYGGPDLREKSLLFGLAPYVRLKKKVNQRLTLYNQADFSVGRTRLVQGQDPSIFESGFPIQKRTQFSLSLRPGFEFNLSPKWFINAQVSLASYEISINRLPTFNTSEIMFGLNASSLNLGVFYRFGKEREKKKVDNDNL